MYERQICSIQIFSKIRLNYSRYHVVGGIISRLATVHGWLWPFLVQGLTLNPVH